jgi:hypothetical protein
VVIIGDQIGADVLGESDVDGVGGRQVVPVTPRVREQGPVAAP